MDIRISIDDRRKISALYCELLIHYFRLNSVIIKKFEVHSFFFICKTKRLITHNGICTPGKDVLLPEVSNR